MYPWYHACMCVDGLHTCIHVYMCDLFVHTCREKPLAVYAFTSDSAKKEKITASTSSGGVVFNDIMVQFAGECTQTPYFTVL